MIKIRFTLTFLIFCLSTLHCFSQNSDEEVRQIKGAKKTQFGIRSGLNYSILSGNLVELIEARFSYHVGAYVQIPVLEKKFLAEIGAFYSLKGTKSSLLYGTEIQNALSLPAIGNLAPAKIDFDFLDFQFILKDNQSEKFSAFGGLEISYLLRSEINQEYLDDTKKVVVYNAVNSTGFSSATVGVIIGLEYHVNRFLHLNTQYTHALTRVVKDSQTDVKNSVIKLSVGFTF